MSCTLSGRGPRGATRDLGHPFAQIETSDTEQPQQPPQRHLALHLALLGSCLLLGACVLSQRTSGAEDGGEPRELALFDPCFIKGPCLKGVIWFPGIEFLGPGWYCKDRLHVKKSDLFDKCHIVAPCFYGAVWTGKRWECAVEDKKKVVQKYEELMQKLMKGPHRADKIWAIRELDHELPKPATSCPERGYQAPKKCRMIGMDHGNLMLGANGSEVLFDLAVCEDAEMRGRASGVLYNIVSDHKANLERLVVKMGGLELLISNMNPETNTTTRSRVKALFLLNMLASECKAQSPDMCTFFGPLTKMSSGGLAQLVWSPPHGSGWQLQVALQEAWVASCTVKGVPSSKDFQACGGNFLKNLTNATTDQAYATLQSLHSLLSQDLWRQKYGKNLTLEVKPIYHKLPAEAKLLAHKLLI